MQKVLIGGASYTEGALWPSVLFPNSEIVNLGKGAAGNTYISDSVIDYVTEHSDVGKVFMVFTHVNTNDVVMPCIKSIEKHVKHYKYYTILKERCYIFSGGDKINYTTVLNYNTIKDKSWPEIKNFTEYLELPDNIRSECEQRGIFDRAETAINEMIDHAQRLSYLDHPDFFSEKTYRAIIHACTILDSKKIPFKFSFYYNPWPNSTGPQEMKKRFGVLNPESKLYSQIDWTRYINFTMWEYGINNNLMCDDGWHLTLEGGKQWAEEAKKYF